MKTPTEQERSELQKLFEKTTETPVINGDGEFDIDYVTWLENYVFNGQSPLVASTGATAEETIFSIINKHSDFYLHHRKIHDKNIKSLIDELTKYMHEYAAAVHPMPTDEEMPLLPFSDKTLMDAILKVYPKGDIRKIAQESRNGIKFYLGDKEINIRPNDSTTLNQEYIDGFTAGFNYVKNLFIEGSNWNEA